MNTIKTALSCLLLSAVLPAFAGPAANPQLLTFEDQATFDPIQGSALKLADGAITLSPGNVWLLGSSVSAFPGSLGNFYGTKNSSDPASNKGALLLTADPDPAPGTSPAAVNSFTINIAEGFHGAFSLDFAGQGDAWLTAFDAAGRTLFTGTPSTETNCAGGYACNWSTLGFDLGGSVDVFSVVVHGADSQQWFDNLSFADVNVEPPPPGTVPEPGGIALSLAALGALAWTRKRIATGKRG